jgi:hypothetical protein
MPPLFDCHEQEKSSQQGLKEWEMSLEARV